MDNVRLASKAFRCPVCRGLVDSRSDKTEVARHRRHMEEELENTLEAVREMNQYLKRLA